MRLALALLFIYNSQALSMESKGDHQLSPKLAKNFFRVVATLHYISDYQLNKEFQDPTQAGPFFAEELAVTNSFFSRWSVLEPLNKWNINIPQQTSAADKAYEDAKVVWRYDEEICALPHDPCRGELLRSFGALNVFFSLTKGLDLEGFTIAESSMAEFIDEARRVFADLLSQNDRRYWLIMNEVLTETCLRALVTGEKSFSSLANL